MCACAAGTAVAACDGGDGVGGAAPQWLSPSLLLHPGAETTNAPLMYKYHSADISHTFSLSLTHTCMRTHTHTRAEGQVHEALVTEAALPTVGLQMRAKARGLRV